VPNPFDADAVRLGAADYDDYIHNRLVGGGSVFGTSIPREEPVHPKFLDHLESASKKAASLITDGDFGVTRIGGQQPRPGNHSMGIAVDIDSQANPYIINEKGKAAYDEVLEKIYKKIADKLLHRESVITHGGLWHVSYNQLAEESDAMAAYFSVLDDAADAAKRAKLPARRKLSGRTFDPELLKTLDKADVKKDYDALVRMGGNTGFGGGGPGNVRDPARGFLTIRNEIVMALRGEGLRWGATDFQGGASGDVMHFDDNDHKGAYEAYGKDHPTDKRKAKDKAEAESTAADKPATP